MRTCRRKKVVFGAKPTPDLAGFPTTTPGPPEPSGWALGNKTSPDLKPPKVGGHKAHWLWLVFLGGPRGQSPSGPLAWQLPRVCRGVELQKPAQLGGHAHGHTLAQVGAGSTAPESWLGQICVATSNKQVAKNWLHFSICACHPRAGAMLIFSVSFQF